METEQTNITPVKSLDDLQEGVVFELADKKTPAVIVKRGFTFLGDEEILLSVYQDGVYTSQVSLRELKIDQGKVKVLRNGEYLSGPYSSEVQRSIHKVLKSKGLAA